MEVGLGYPYLMILRLPKPAVSGRRDFFRGNDSEMIMPLSFPGQGAVPARLISGSPSA